MGWKTLNEKFPVPFLITIIVYSQILYLEKIGFNPHEILEHDHGEHGHGHSDMGSALNIEQQVQPSMVMEKDLQSQKNNRVTSGKDQIQDDLGNVKFSQSVVLDKRGEIRKSHVVAEEEEDAAEEQFKNIMKSNMGAITRLARHSVIHNPLHNMGKSGSLIHFDKNTTQAHNSNEKIDKRRIS